MELIKDNYLRGFETGDTWRVEIDPSNRPVKSYFKVVSQLSVNQPIY